VNTLFVVVAGPEMGLGHLTRCRVLMLELARRGWPVELLFVGPDATLDRWNWPAQVALNRLGDNPADAQVHDAIAAKLGAGKINWVVVDGYRFRGDSWRAQVNAAGARLLMLDDIGDEAFAADAVLNQNNDDRNFYAGRAISADRWLLGPHFALIEPEYVAAPDQALNAELQRVLVVFGGADRRQLTPKAVKLLAALTPPLTLDVVLGPFSKWTDPPADTPRLKFHRAPQGLLALLMQADAVVTAAGSTVWQACAARCPAVAIQTVDNQAQVVTMLRAADAAVVAEADALESTLPRAIESLRPLQNRTALAARARKLVDGAGSTRVVESLMAW
jgi:UDP-2,4-diacetamido-2,4,6-trideoxy-beta-L-altropyranose hydrolase